MTGREAPKALASAAAPAWFVRSVIPTNKWRPKVSDNQNHKVEHEKHSRKVTTGTKQRGETKSRESAERRRRRRRTGKWRRRKRSTFAGPTGKPTTLIDASIYRTENVVRQEQRQQTKQMLQQTKQILLYPCLDMQEQPQNKKAPREVWGNPCA